MPDMISFAEKPISVDGPGPVSVEKKPYYPSITIPAEVFGGNIPNVGTQFELLIKCDTNEIRKTENRGTEVRAEVLKGKVSSDKSDKSKNKKSPLLS